MENILKKALGEALTELYSAELHSAADTKHKFSPEFEYEMKKLVRRTDRPLYLSTGFLAAAACAVLAIGCAAIVPLLGRTNVPSHIEETTTAASVSADITTAVTEESEAASTTAPALTSAFTTSALTVVSPAEPEEAAVSAADDNENSSASETSVPVTTTGTAPASPASEEALTAVPTEDEPSDTTESADAAPLVIDAGSADEEDEGGDLTVSDEEAEEAFEREEEEIVENDADYDEEAEGEAIDEEEADYDDDDRADDLADGDDFCDDEPSSDESEDDYDYDETPITDEDYDDDISLDDDDDAYPSAETLMLIKLPRADTLGELTEENFGISFDTLSPYSVDYYERADGARTARTFEAYKDCEYAKEFVRSLAEAADRGKEPAVYDEKAPMAEIFITNGRLIETKKTMCNSSEWLNYALLYGQGEDADVPVDDDDLDEEDYTFSMKLKIYENGLVAIDGRIVCEGADENGSLFIYSGTFQIDESRAREFMNDTRRLLIPSDAATVGDLADRMNITAENIGEHFANVFGVYDTQLWYADISPAYIEELFARYATKALSDEVPGYTSHYAEAVIRLRDSGAKLSVRVSADGKCIIKDMSSVYCFDISEDEIADAIAAVRKATGLDIPDYSTLAEFLKCKNFNNIVAAGIGEVSLSDAAELKKLKAMITDAAKTAKYLPSGENSGGRGITVSVEGYFYELFIRPDDTVMLGSNVFKCESGFYEKAARFLSENKKSVKKADMRQGVADDSDDLLRYDEDDFCN